jgi:hypothetical protein
MRSELTTLEQIDMYLSGNLSPAEHAAFEAKISADPNLESAVSQQQELIKAVNRKALRAQINAAAAAGGGASGMSNLWIGITSVVGVGLLTAGLIYYNMDTETVMDDANLAIEDSEIIVTDSTIINFVSEEETLIREEPETIFSSVNSYEKLDENQLNVDVNPVLHGENVVEENVVNDGNMVETNNGDNVVERRDSDITIGTDRTRRASYPGGHYAMDKFIDKNLHYPRSARNKGIEGVVRCEFFVTADGLITEIDAKCTKMSEGDGPAFNDVKMLLNKKIMNAFINNATHILRTMPNWEPAMNSQGNPILSPQRMYFNYDLDKGCLVYQLDDGPFIQGVGLDQEKERN